MNRKWKWYALYLWLCGVVFGFGAMGLVWWPDIGTYTRAATIFGISVGLIFSIINFNRLSDEMGKRKQ